MPVYPYTPRPAMVTMPELIDPMLSFSTDQGISVRRPRTSRPRRRWRMDYLGLSTENARLVRDFLQTVRLGVLAFEWLHPTAVDVATVFATTPVHLVYPHGLYTGMWLAVSNSPNPGINGGVFQVTRVAHNDLVLNGSVAAGIAGSCTVIPYVPRAIAIMEQDTFPAATTLIGPDQVENIPLGFRRGFFNLSVTVEEQF
jgi:hypothetical protein